MEDNRPVNNVVPGIVLTIFIFLGLLLFFGIINSVVSTTTLNSVLSGVDKLGIGFVAVFYFASFILGFSVWWNVNSIGHSLDPGDSNGSARDSDEQLLHKDSNSSLYDLLPYLFYFFCMGISFYVQSFTQSLIISFCVLFVWCLVTILLFGNSFASPIDGKYWNSNVIFILIGLISIFSFGTTGGFLRWSVLPDYEWIDLSLNKEFWLRWEIGAVLLHIVVVFLFMIEFWSNRDIIQGERPQRAETADWALVYLLSAISFFSFITSAAFFFGSISSSASLDTIYISGLDCLNMKEDWVVNDLHPRYIIYAYLITLSLSIMVFVDWSVSYLAVDYSYEFSLRDMILFGDVPLLIGTTTLIISYISSIFVTDASFLYRSAFFGGGIAFQLIVINCIFLFVKIKEVNESYKYIRRTYYICINQDDSCDLCYNGGCPSCSAEEVNTEKHVWVKDTGSDNLWT